ncbi:MAG: RDD family protein [Rhodanobacteraceae bacterium]
MEAASAGNPQALPVHRSDPALYAGFWRRVVAWVIDFVIVTVIAEGCILLLGIWLLVSLALSGAGHGVAMTRLVDTALQPLVVVIAWLYYAVCESSSWQATIGKLTLGLRVTDGYGERIDFGRASGRHFGKYVSALIFGFGFLLAGWTARKQALHDLLAGCCVARRNGLAALRQQATSFVAPEAPEPERVPVARQRTPGRAVALLAIVGCCLLAVPVLAIIAAFAFPAWHGYNARAEVSQGVESTARPRALVGEYIGERGTLPTGNADLGLPRPDAMQNRYVASIRVAEGKLLVTYGNEASAMIRGRHVILAPQGDAAMLRWQCSSPDIDVRYLPQQCRR